MFTCENDHGSIKDEHIVHRHSLGAFPFVVDDGSFDELYAIDPTNINFTNAIVTVTATSNTLYKCKEWNFTEQNCEGSWELFKTGLVPGENYTFILTYKFEDLRNEN